MIKRIAQNIKAQNTAEYAILISLAVAGIIAMQRFAQRALQARVHGAGKYLKDNTSQLGNTFQYEPYYKDSDFDTKSNVFDAKGATADGGYQTKGSRTETRNGVEITDYGVEDLDDGIIPEGD